MSSLPSETLDALKRDALHGAATGLIHAAAFLMAGAWVASPPDLQAFARAGRENLLEVIRLVKLLQDVEVHND